MIQTKSQLAFFFTFYFQDCLKLLNTSTGSLILSLETLQSPDTRSGDSILKELGITRLSVEQAVAVINTRVELTV